MIRSPYPFLTFVCALLAGLCSSPNSRAEETDRQVGSMIETVASWQYPRWSKEEKKHVIADGNYLKFVPQNWDGSKPLPVVVFLHSGIGRGTDIAKMRDDIVPSVIAEGRKLDAIVLCPQVEGYWGAEAAVAFLDVVSMTHGADPDRIYLVGVELGGGGAWEAAKQRAADLAAVIAVCTNIAKTAGAEKLVNLPIWAFHNVNDPYQPADKTRAQVNAARAAGAKYVFYTEYTDQPGRLIGEKWVKAHQDSWEMSMHDDAVWDWLFRQRRGKPELALPEPKATARELIKGLPTDY